MMELQLKSGREKSLKRHHPWIFSGAVERVNGKPGRGDMVDVRDSHGQTLARAAYSPDSQIRARVWSFDSVEEVDAGFFRQRLMQALALREALAAGRDVLDGFGYTGGFAINALAGGATRIVAVESSAPSLEVARENLAANALDASRVEFVHADAFAHLRTLRDRAAQFDLVVL